MSRKTYHVTAAGDDWPRRRPSAKSRFTALARFRRSTPTTRIPERHRVDAHLFASVARPKLTETQEAYE